MIELFVEEKKILDIRMLIQPIVLHHASMELENVAIKNARDKLFVFYDDNDEITMLSDTSHINFECKGHHIRIPVKDVFPVGVREKFNQSVAMHQIRETSAYDYSDQNKYFVRVSICILPNHIREDITPNELEKILLNQKYEMYVSLLPQEFDTNALYDQETLQKIRDVLKAADERKMTRYD